MKECARKLYKGTAWKKLRAEYIKSVGGLCERCLKRGQYKAAVIVHHKEYISPDNVWDETIALNADNLEALCRECHEREHRRAPARYEVDAMGRVTAIE